MVPFGGDDAGLGGQPGLVAGPRGPGRAAFVAPGGEGDGVAAGAGGEVAAVAELVRPPRQPQAGYSGRLPNCQHAVISFRAWGVTCQASRSAAEVMRRGMPPQSSVPFEAYLAT